MGLEWTERDGKYGVKDEKAGGVPATYKHPEDALKEWKWFNLDNTNSEPHRRYLPYFRLPDEIDSLEKELKAKPLPESYVSKLRKNTLLLINRLIKRQRGIESTGTLTSDAIKVGVGFYRIIIN